MRIWRSLRHSLNFENMKLIVEVILSLLNSARRFACMENML